MFHLECIRMGDEYSMVLIHSQGLTHAIYIINVGATQHGYYDMTTPAIHTSILILCRVIIIMSTSHAADR